MKTQEKLSGFKRQVRAFHAVIVKVNKVWNDNKYVTVSTLVQNLGFDSRLCVNHDIDEAVEKCKNIIKALRTIADYNKDCHFSNWIAEECEMLFDGHYIQAD